MESKISGNQSSNNSVTNRIIISFWISIIIIVIIEGLIPATASQPEIAKERIQQVGYPEYFVFFKLPGALAVFIPQVP